MNIFIEMPTDINFIWFFSSITFDGGGGDDNNNNTEKNIK